MGENEEKKKKGELAVRFMKFPRVPLIIHSGAVVCTEFMGAFTVSVK